MLKILIWVVSKDTQFLKDAINILERQDNGIEIVGKAAGENISSADKNFDVLLVIGAKKIGMNKISQVARQLNLPEEKLLGDWIVCIPGFTLEKYRHVQCSRLSVFTMNCFGGVLLHTLGLPFNSPFVNMFFDEQDYLRFLHEPQAYLEKDLIFKETKWQNELKFYYPVVELGDIAIHMNHYRSFDEAVDKWNRRKARINWYNLFVTMYTEREEILQEFDALPYGKKICFVPFKSDLPSAWQINSTVIKNAPPFWDVVNRFGFGNPFWYDPFDMLLYGKKTPLIEI